MESHQNKIISVENITVDFGNFRALDNVSAEINAGDFVAITGPNGGGKSTLLKTMLHLLTPTKGRVRYFNGDEEVDSLRFGYLDLSIIGIMVHITFAQTICFLRLIKQKKLY